MIITGIKDFHLTPKLMGIWLISIYFLFGIHLTHFHKILSVPAHYHPDVL